MNKLKPRIIYLDYAAATPLDLRVLKSMNPYFSTNFFNPSADYLKAKAVEDDLSRARSTIAEIIGSKPTEVVFTAGATEANNLAVKGVMDSFPGAKVVFSSIEHDSVIEPSKLYNYMVAPVNSEGIVEIAKLIDLVDDKTVLVSIMYANNEVGSIQPIRQISQALKLIKDKRLSKKTKLPLYLHVDAAQAGNYLDLHVAGLGVDLMSVNGGKLYGPKQSGFLFIKSGTKIWPQILGGGQEMGLRSGTENVPGCIGLAKALTIAQETRHQEDMRLKELQTLFIKLLNNKFPDVIINGSIKYRLVNNVHISLPGTDNERVLILLDQANILAAAGSACSASSEEPSHVLTAMGISDSLARASLRFSLGRSTSEADIRRVVETLSSLPISS